MRYFFLAALILFAWDAKAEPVVTRSQGGYSQGMVLPITGQYFQGQVKLDQEKDLRDSVHLRLQVNLENLSRTPATFAIYIGIQDSVGRLLAAEGYEESVFLREPTWKLDHEIDLAMPSEEQSRIAQYQIILLEDNQRLK